MSMGKVQQALQVKHQLQASIRRMTPFVSAFENR